MYLPSADVNVSTFTMRLVQRFTKSCALPKVVKDKLIPMPSSVQGMQLRPTVAELNVPYACLQPLSCSTGLFLPAHRKSRKSLGNCRELFKSPVRSHRLYLHVSLTVHCDIASRFQPSQQSAFLPTQRSKRAISKNYYNFKLSLEVSRLLIQISPPHLAFNMSTRSRCHHANLRRSNSRLQLL